MPSIKRLLGGTKNAYLAIGGIASAGLAIWAAVQTILPSGGEPKSPPVTPAVRFEEAQVEPNVLLEQYVSLNQAGRLGSAFEAPRARRLDVLLVAGTATSASARPGIGPAVYLTADVSTTGASSQVDQSSSNGSAIVSKPGEGEGTGSGATGGTGATGNTGATGASGATGATGTTGAGQARQREEEETRKKHEAEARKRREKLEAKIAREAAEADTLFSNHGKHKLPAPPGYTHFVAPHAPARAFHREKNARVLVGTGAPASQVNAVLRKVGQILANDGVGHSVSATSFDMTNAAFETSDPSFRRIAAAAPAGSQGGASHGQTTGASIQLHTRCNAACALLPLIDNAILDTYSNLAEAAREVAGIFTDTRYDVFEHRRQPIGVTVDYKIDLRDYVGKKMYVVWTLSKTTGQPLSKTWWRNVLVKQVEPTADDAPILGNFWAPVPRDQGSYRFELKVFNGAHEEERAVTGMFH